MHSNALAAPRRLALDVHLVALFTYPSSHSLRVRAAADGRAVWTAGGVLAVPGHHVLNAGREKDSVAVFDSRRDGSAKCLADVLYVPISSVGVS